VELPRILVYAGLFALFVSVGVLWRASSRAPEPAPTTYAEAREIVERHCVSCHSEETTVPAFPVAAGGVKLDTAEQMGGLAPRIRERVAVKRDMPLLNKTNMTDDERAVLERWALGGAAAP
jgi:uncharacterized membrane protein